MELSRLGIWWSREAIYARFFSDRTYERFVIDAQYVRSLVFLSDLLILFVVPLIVTAVICKVRNFKKSISASFTFFVLALASELDGCLLFARYCLIPSITALAKAPVKANQRTAISEQWTEGVSSFSLDGKENTLVMRRRPCILLEFAEPCSFEQMKEICEERFDSDCDWNQWYACLADQVRTTLRTALAGKKESMRFQIVATAFPDKHFDLRAVPSSSDWLKKRLSGGNLSIPFPAGPQPTSVVADLLVDLEGTGNKLPAIEETKEPPRFCAIYKLCNAVEPEPKATVMLAKKNGADSKLSGTERKLRKLAKAVALHNKLGDCADNDERITVYEDISRLYASVFGSKENRSELKFLETILKERVYLIRKGLLRIEDDQSSESKAKDFSAEMESDLSEAAKTDPKALFLMGRLVLPEHAIAGHLMIEMSAEKGYHRAMYFYGHGKESIPWLHKAAKANNLDAIMWEQGLR